MIVGHVEALRLMKSSAFFFPVLFWLPGSEHTEATTDKFSIAARRWQTTTFDLATLATKHNLHLPYQLMDVFLSQCNLEVRVEADDLESAVDRMEIFLLGTSLEGISPTITPFATSHSINDYSGINSRDSSVLREKLSSELQFGMTSEDITVEAWPILLSLHCKLISDAREISNDCFRRSAEKARHWIDLERRHPLLKVVRDAARVAPLLPSNDQSLLHIWCALESLFPTVTTEVNFRVGLYLAQLIAPKGDRQNILNRVRKGYNVRSKVAHGAQRGIGDQDWRDAWELLMASCNAIVARDCLPSENALLSELLEVSAS